MSPEYLVTFPGVTGDNWEGQNYTQVWVILTTALNFPTACSLIYNTPLTFVEILLPRLHFCGFYNSSIFQKASNGEMNHFPSSRYEILPDSDCYLHPFTSALSVSSSGKVNFKITPTLAKCSENETNKPWEALQEMSSR